ncbi:MAG: YlxR family protein [Anaerolineaceae bacterium]
MAKKARPRVKHIPQRTCVGCRETLAKRSLIRLVRTEDGIMIDKSGKLSGRGAYLHNVRSCWEAGLKGSLARALKIELTDADRIKLKEFSAYLPDDSSEAV